MNLLVSDYDGTFKSNLKNLEINITKVNEFMEKGNKFAIATGREYESIKRETNYYNIKYDYLICNNGSIIFDNNDNVTYSNPLSDEDLDYIRSSLEKETRFYNIKLYNFYSETVNPKNILEVLAIFETSMSAKNFKKYLESVKNNIHCYRFDKYIFIGNYSTKATAINEIASIENIKLKKIYTVGNDVNDIEMIEEFNGYKMLNSDKKLLFKKFPIVSEVHKLIDKIK